MERGMFYASTICYYHQQNRVLMLQFDQKYGQRWCAPGGKVEGGESPRECIIREFREETGLILKKPQLVGVAQWRKSPGNETGFVFVYACGQANGSLLTSSKEGRLSWVDLKELSTKNLFAMNRCFLPYVLERLELPGKSFGSGRNLGTFEGKFLLDALDDVVEFEIWFD